MRPTRFAIYVAVALVFVATTAEAALLAPGAILSPAPGEAGPTGGMVLATQTLPLVSPTYSGTLTSTVTSGDTTNPFAGGLTFTYVLSNNLGSHSINRITINGFDGFQLDASYQTPPPAGTAIPAFIDRETGVGSAIGYDFASAPVGSGSLLPGQTSAVMVVQTNATSFVPSQAFVLNGFPATVGTFAPVPEPSTLLLVAGAGLGLVIHRLSRRSRSRQ